VLVSRLGIGHLSNYDRKMCANLKEKRDGVNVKGFINLFNT